MYKKVLIVTVGGSDEVIVQAIKKYHPDYIFFICSGGNPKVASEITVDGKGNVCVRKREIRCPYCKRVIVEKEEYPNILEQSGYNKQSGYKDKYKKVILDDPDDFSEIYKKTKETIEKAKKIGREIICDFTGGTKIMSSVLAILSAFDFDLKLSFSKGKRENTVKITKESFPIVENINSARIDFFMNTVDSLIFKHLYYPAKLILEQLTEKELGNYQKRILRKIEICDAFYHWDNFEYEKAYEMLKGYSEQYPEQWNYLLKILGKIKNSGYEPVLDLIKNAERQAENGFYDNGVARLYRGIELLAQIRLKKEYKIETGHLEKSLDKVKDKEKWERKKDKKGEIKIGLVDDYELLAELEDPFGKIYKEKEKKLQNQLKIRNLSKLAHGDNPITEKEWIEFFTFSKNYIENCLSEIKVKIEYPVLPDKIQ